MILKEYFEKVNFEKKISRRQQKNEKVPSMQSVTDFLYRECIESTGPEVIIKLFSCLTQRSAELSMEKVAQRPGLILERIKCKFDTLMLLKLDG